MRRMSTALAVVLIVATTIGVTAAPSGATPEAIQPQRILDTRSGLGAPAQRLAPGQVLSLRVSAAAAAGAPAVSINLTATEATGPGFLTAWPCGQAQPATSVLNFVPGQSVANFISLGLGTDAQGMGAVCLAASAPTHVVADLMG